jgi:hypothetical protein
MLLLGAWLDRLEEERSAGVSAAVRATAALLGVIGIVLTADGLALPWLIHSLPPVVELAPSSVRQQVRLAWILGGGAAVLGAVLVLHRQRADGPSASEASLGLATALALMMLLVATGRSFVTTSRNLAAAISREARPGDLVVQYRGLQQGLCFYLRGRIVQIGEYGEIYRGVWRDAARRDYFWDGTKLLEREWTSGRGVFIATTRRYLAELEERLVPPPRVVVDDGQRLLLANRRPEDAPSGPPMVHRESVPLFEPEVADTLVPSEPARGGKDPPAVS